MPKVSAAISSALARRRWLPAAAVVAPTMLFCFVDKLVALPAILDVYATRRERTFAAQTAGLALALVEDLHVATLLLALLLVVELVAAVVAKVQRCVVDKNKLRVLRVLGTALRSLVVLVVVLLVLAPFAADMLLLRSREMRFTSELIVTAIRERDQAAGLEVEPREIRLAKETIVGVALYVIVFTGVYIRYIDLLSMVAPSHAADPKGKFMPVALSANEDLEVSAVKKNKELAMADASSLSDDDDDLETISASSSVDDLEAPPTKKIRIVKTFRGPWYTRGSVKVAVVVLAWLALLGLAALVSHAASPIVAAIALNATLNEIFRNAFHFQFQRSTGSGAIESVGAYLQWDSEHYTLFKDDVLYRKTTGFKGPLAFDVDVDPKNPPNVLIIGVESFRYMDSLYMAENTKAGELMQKNNLTVTPQFDRWAKRGIAFNNMWSSWQTSRSLEAILFGQLVYDTVSNSGTTYGKKDTKLVGMPQMFKQKGYETVFTTGCITTYDQWDIFLPSHGFDTVIAAPDMKKIAERDYGIKKAQWDGKEHRGFGWGVHDDISFDILGDLMINKTKLQADRVKRGESKNPFFLNHYTISSHHTFDAHPTWLDSEKLPDFTPLCEGWESECTLIKKYAKLRYFTDMELGRFLDRMEKEGILNDTIVVIVGDHGQSPEMGLANPMLYQTAVTHVASTMIAEGRLGKYAGMVYNDATHHYDLLNTLADIVGVPEEGFLQTGVGRSLKRQLPYGERLVYSNNPMKKMSIVRGHERFVYDRTSNDMGLFDTIKDPLEKNDLLPTRDNAEIAGWYAKRKAGRQLNTYFKNRWEKKCLAKVDCS